MWHPIALLVVGVVAMAPADDPPARPAAKTSVEAWWEALAKDDGPATLAALKLASHPDEAVAFFKEELKPLALDYDLLETLLEWLGSDDETVWKGAFAQLEYLDPRLCRDLPMLMNLVTETPARTRMVEVMSGRPPDSLKGKDVQIRAVGDDGYNFTADNGSWWAEHKVERINMYAWGMTHKKWTRAVRAIAVLEYINTPAAKAVLESMATGHPEAQPTKAAKEALGRLAAP